MGGNRRATSIHRHLASVGAAITGVIGGLFLTAFRGLVRRGGLFTAALS